MHPDDKGHIRILHGWKRDSRWWQEVCFFSPIVLKIHRAFAETKCLGNELGGLKLMISGELVDTYGTGVFPDFYEGGFGYVG